MGTKKIKEAITILLDVGENMRQLTSTRKTYLESSKDCISQIIQRKLFSQSPDEIGLIIFGSKETKNELASLHGGYENIVVLSKHLSLANWDLLRYINEVNINQNFTADWLDAIIVALQFIKDEAQEKKFENKKMVIFSNFESQVSDDQVQCVINFMKEICIDLVVIGPDVQNVEYSPGLIKSKIQTDGEILICNIVNDVDGVICNFEDAFSELMYFQRKGVRPTPWNSILTISNKIKIPISAYKKVAETAPMKWISEVIDDRKAGVSKEKAFVKYIEERGIETEIQKEDVIDAYQFGSTIVPFSDIDKEAMAYISGPKGLYLIGCTHKSKVPHHILVGSGCYVVISKKDDEIGKIALEAFIEGLNEANMVGIARRIYSNNSAVFIGALFPVVTAECRYFILAELPFAEDEHVYKFPSLSHMKPTEAQFNAVGDLIDCMNLDETEKKSEMYDLTKIYDHHEQYVLRCISYKALHPNNPLPAELMESIKSNLKPSPELLELCEPSLKRIKQEFPLQKIEEKSQKKIFSRNNNNDLKDEDNEVKKDNPPASDINLVYRRNEKDISVKGNDIVNDVVLNQDIELLLKEGKSFSGVFQKMQTTIEKLVSSSPIDLDKLVKVLKNLREYSFDNVQIYNDWIRKFKIMLDDQKNLSLWNDIIRENLGLITKVESSKSDIELETAEDFSKLNDEEYDSVYYSQNTFTMDQILNEL